jgi:hypothetical protein
LIARAALTPRVVILRLTQSVIKSRPLKKIGAEQILLDVQAVKACLLDLPEPHTESSSSVYVKYVTKNTGQLETLVKVILAPDVRSLPACSEFELTSRTHQKALCRTIAS